MNYEDEFEERQPDLKKAAEAAEKSFNRAVKENIEAFKEHNRRENARLHGCPDCTAARCSETCPRYLTHYASRAEFWDWWGKTSPPDSRKKDPILHLPAPPAKKGGNKSRKRKKKLTFKNLYMET